MSQGSHVILSRCWKQIGVFGDSTCAKLAELVHCRNCLEYNKAGRNLFDHEIPADFLEEWTKSLTGVKEAEAPDTISVIVVRIKDEWLAFKTIYLQEATNMRPVHRIPFRTNDVFKGIVNINGELILCVSITDLLENVLAGDEGKCDAMVYKRMVVINKEGERYAFPVDEVLGIYRVSLCDLQEPPVTISKSPAALIEGIFNLNEKKVGLMAEDKFIHALKRSLES